MDMTVLLDVLRHEHEVYTAMYNSQASDDAPGKKEWLAKLDTSVYDVSPAFNEAREDGASAEDPAQVLALIQGLDELRKELKTWLDGMFAAENNKAANKVDGVSTPEEIKAQLQKVRDAFDAANMMVGLGHLDLKDVKYTLSDTAGDGSPVLYWEDKQNTRNGKVVSTVFSYKPVGTVKVRTKETNDVGPKKNSKRIRLVVNGELSPEEALGEACRKAGITHTQLQEAVIVEFRGKNGWTDEKNYSNAMVSINGTVFGLRVV